MSDVLPDEAGRWRWVEERARALFGAFGYDEIRTPVLERTELFVRSLGESTDVVEKEMYTFTTGSGESLTLRPEGTAPVVRAFVQHSLAQRAPANRLYYLGPMFRHERPQKGRSRQFHQIGAEVIGAASPEADAEIIALLWAILGEIQLEGIRLELTSLGCRDCRPGYLALLQTFAAEHAADLCENCNRRRITNPLRILDCKVERCRAALADAPLMPEHLCAACSAHHAGVERLLGTLAIPYAANPRIVRGLDYYVRTAFEVTTDRLGSQNAVAGGGRYDGLVAGFGGPDAPGVGFAMGLERVLELAGPTPAASPRLFLASHGDEARLAAFELAHRLRLGGVRIETSLEATSMKSQMRRAQKIGAARVLMIGESELAAGTVRIKDMTTGAEEEVRRDLDVLLTRLRGGREAS
ncbi:MAG: histidine--tRNA ligase [bacterium]